MKENLETLKTGGLLKNNTPIIPIDRQPISSQRGKANIKNWRNFFNTSTAQPNSLPKTTQSQPMPQVSPITYIPEVSENVEPSNIIPIKNKSIPNNLISNKSVSNNPIMDAPGLDEDLKIIRETAPIPMREELAAKEIRRLDREEKNVKKVSRELYNKDKIYPSNIHTGLKSNEKTANEIKELQNKLSILDKQNARASQLDGPEI